MTGHSEQRFDLPGYVAGRLGPAEREEVARHLAECEECRELEESIREIASAIREGGEAIFEPHPPERLLRRIGQGEVVPEREGIERHLRLCATCELEVEAWKAEASGAPLAAAGRPEPTRRSETRSAMRFGLGVAAGLVVGVGLAIAFRGAFLPEGGTGPTRVPAAAPPPASALLLRILPAAMRGESKVARWEIGRPEKWIAVAVPLALPERFEEGTPIRFELASREGAGATSVILGAGEVRRHLAASEMVNLIIPTDRLRPGRYDFTVRPDSPGGPEALYRTEVEIAEPPDRPGGESSP